MSTYSIDMRGDETERTSFVASVIGFHTQLDDAGKAIYRNIAASETAKAFAKTNHLDITKFLETYIAIARRLKRSYAKSEYDLWISEFVKAGADRAAATFLLNQLRVLREAGRVGDAVWSPVTWAEEHPGDQGGGPLDKLMHSLGEGLKKFGVIVGVGFLAYLILPKLLLSGAKAYRERKAKIA